MRSLSVDQCFLVANISIYRQDMPGVERFAIGRINCEWCHLTLCEAELLGVVEVMPKECVDLMGV